jgi:acyl carrier protein
MDLIDEIRALIAEKLMVNVESPQTDLLQDGVLDSVSLVQLILHLEERFGVRIELQDLELDDLKSVGSIANLVAARAVTT